MSLVYYSSRTAFSRQVSERCAVCYELNIYISIVDDANVYAVNVTGHEDDELMHV